MVISAVVMFVGGLGFFAKRLQGIWFLTQRHVPVRNLAPWLMQQIMCSTSIIHMVSILLPVLPATNFNVVDNIFIPTSIWIPLSTMNTLMKFNTISMLSKNGFVPSEAPCHYNVCHKNLVSFCIFCLNAFWPKIGISKYYSPSSRHQEVLQIEIWDLCWNSWEPWLI